MDEPANKPALRTLLLEDDTLARWVARKALEEVDAHVIEAADCAEAREKIDALHFDAFVVDYRLPDGNGKEVVEYLRKKTDAPVIVLSAETEEFSEDVTDALAITGVLSKPVDVEELQAVFCRLKSDASPSKDTETAAPTASPTDARYVDRFKLTSVSSQLPETTIRQMLTSIDEDCWLALDFTCVTNLDVTTIDSLSHLAAQCRTRGGRLALINVSETVAEQITTRGIHNEFDIVEEERSLEALSRRLSSYCERSALLETIILPPETEGVES